MNRFQPRGRNYNRQTEKKESEMKNIFYGTISGLVIAEVIIRKLKR